MLLEPNKAEIVITTCVYLHNYLRKNKSSKDAYSPSDFFDREVEEHNIGGTWRQETNNALRPLERMARRATRLAEENRNEFADYFCGNGAVSWQAKLA